jgi:hypothetical protein
MQQLYTGKELWGALTRAIDSCRGRIAICAGHFLLVHDDRADQAVPSIVEEIQNAELRGKVLATFGRFPAFTFEIGAELLKYALDRGRDAHLTLLVNDWQYVRTDPNRNPSDPNQYRSRFYSQFKQPPVTFRNILENLGLRPEESWLGDQDDGFFYRETRLRDRFKRSAKRRARSGEILSECIIMNRKGEDFLGHRYVLECSDGRRVPLVEFGKAGCAGEIAEMTNDLTWNHQIDCMIYFLPVHCRPAVDLGIEMSLETSVARSRRIISVYPEEIARRFEDELFSMSDFTQDPDPKN